MVLHRVIMWKVIVLCAIVSLAAAQKAVFNNYKVFKLIPTTETQLEILRQLENGYDGVSRFSLSYTNMLCRYKYNFIPRMPGIKFCSCLRYRMQCLRDYLKFTQN